MFEELVHAVLEQWAHITVAIFAGVGFAKVLSVLIPLLPAAYGIYIKWRNSGYRLVDRLEEFLTDQEAKVAVSRSQLAKLLHRPPIDNSAPHTAFDGKALRKIVRKLDWGFGTAAPNDLSGAVLVSGKRAALARKQAKEHDERQALAHLLLGAKAAAQQIEDPARRNAARSEALEEFDNALKINPRDPEALEYSVMMLLELNEPNVALERIKTLISLRKKEEYGANLGRAHRLEALAYENQTPPKNKSAYEALLKAVDELPPGMMIDCGLIYEHLAKIAQKLNFTDAPERHLRRAWDCYHKMRNSGEGQKGLLRVSADLSTIQSAKGDGAKGPKLAVLASSPTQDAPRPTKASSLFSRLTTKPSD